MTTRNLPLGSIGAFDFSLSPRAFASALLSGGDERLAVEADGLNKYGCAPRPRGDEEFGSCTSSTISERGHLAAFDLWRALCARPSSKARLAYVEQRFESVRERLWRWLGESPTTGEIILTPSGTDAELLALFAAAPEPGAALHNVVVAPDEVGSGTLLAAGCFHFARQTPSGRASRPGTPICAPLAASVDTSEVQVRDPTGAVRPESDIVEEILDHAGGALAAGKAVLVHAVAHSKTGICAPGLEALRRLDGLGERASVLVDAAQGRIAKETIRHHLARGRMVLFTGSKYFGGPTFSGALFLPRGLSECGVARLPDGYGGYFTRSELPATWRNQRASLDERVNVGLLLRWEAALAEMIAHDAIDTTTQEQILTLFHESIVSVFSEPAWIRLVSAKSEPPRDRSREAPIEKVPTVFNFLIEEAGAPINKAALARWHGWLNRPLSAFLRHGLGAEQRTVADREFHLGQPVVVSPGAPGDPLAVLRIALGVPLLVELASMEEEARRQRVLDKLLGLRAKLELIREFRENLGCA